MALTLNQLRKCIPYAGPRAALFHPHLVAAMAEFSIDAPMRQAAFLAQIAHESGSLRYVLEIASGEAYDTGRLAARLGNTPEADGDGQRYKGRGLIQITGRDNYRSCSLALYGDERLLEIPSLLEEPVDACRSAAWFWSSRKLNELADTGAFRAITRVINGGFNGYADRLAYYERAQAVLC